ncbi:hypothetical protein DEF24_10630, partial [Marinitenerispora sediminis]
MRKRYTGWIAMTGAAAVAGTTAFGAPAVLAAEDPPSAAPGLQQAAVSYGLDGFDVGYLPPGLDRLGIAARSASDDDGNRVSQVSWKADAGEVLARVSVLRHAGMADVEQFRAAEFPHLDPAALEAVDNNGRIAYLSRATGELFWLEDPGVAVGVFLRPETWRSEELTAMGAGVRPQRTAVELPDFWPLTLLPRPEAPAEPVEPAPDTAPAQPAPEPAAPAPEQGTQSAPRPTGPAADAPPTEQPAPQPAAAQSPAAPPVEQAPAPQPAEQPAAPEADPAARTAAESAGTAPNGAAAAARRCLVAHVTAPGGGGAVDVAPESAAAADPGAAPAERLPGHGDAARTDAVALCAERLGVPAEQVDDLVVTLAPPPLVEQVLGMVRVEGETENAGTAAAADPPAGTGAARSTGG